MASRVYIAVSSFARQAPEPLNILKQSGLGVDINTAGRRLTKEEVMGNARGYHGIIAGLEPYDAQVLEALPDLKCISRCGVGVDNIDLEAADKKGIKIFTTPDVVVQPVVELTLAMILNLLRKITQQDLLMRGHQWQRMIGSQLAGKTVGIIGLGRIGRKVAEILLLLGARVVGYDVHPDRAWAEGCGVSLVDLDQVLSCCDILTLHLAAKAGDHFVLTRQHFQAMKKGALLINVARGTFVDEKALLEALQEGHLSGAGLDVFQQEPYAGPLSSCPQVVLTPHVGSFTQESRVAMEMEAAQNIVGFFNK
ncbi:MAG: phosphoglycerate dehydrogenase [Candidatus Omnitrophica bacterium]|nr:phosphoglycerate dehydrogenase [Candidatus Omnitrophota bacterium]